ncbi:DUF6603 domain-containing protein [Ancylobacter sp.]|uniref:DUF6603 domain-containing protein n=1 Tax=Ancylobacter sp. TaxID=1872567 RepID=UPI003D13C685
MTVIEPDQFETLGLGDHGCVLLDDWLLSLSQGGGAVSAQLFELPVFAAKGTRSAGTRSVGTRVFLAARERYEVWRPGEAFGEFKPSRAVIDKALCLRAVQLRYSSYDFAAAGAAGGKASAGDLALIRRTAEALDGDWPHELAPLRAGLNFTGEATLLPNLDAAMRKRFGLEGSVRVAGCVGRSTGGCWIEAHTALAVAPLVLLNGRLSIALATASIGAERVNAGATPQFSLALQGRIALDDQDLAASIRIDPVAKQLAIVADAPGLIKAGALLKGLAPEIETALGEALGSLDAAVPGLRRLEITTPLTGLDGAHVALWLGYGQPFTLFDLLRVTPSLHAKGTFKSEAVTFEAEFTGIGEMRNGAEVVRFETVLSLPDGSFHAGLASGSTASLPEALAATLAPVGGRESLQFVDLAIDANMREGSCSFSVVTAGFLAFPVGSGTLLIGDVRFEISRQRQAGFTARLEATLGIGDVEANVEIDIDDGMKGSLFLPRLPIGALAADLLQITAPDELSAVEIDDVEVSLTLGRQAAFAFSATSGSAFAVAGLTVKLAALEVRHEGALSLSGKGTIRFDTAEVALDLDYAGGTWNVTFGTDTPFDLGRALGAIAREIGFEPPFQAESVIVTRMAGALRLGSEGTRIALNFGFRIKGDDARLTLVAARLKPDEGGWDYSLRMGPATIDFRDLPVIGEPIGAAADALAKQGGKKTVGIEALRLGVVSTPEAADIAALFAHLPVADFPPPVDVTGTLSLTGTLRLLDYEKAISYPPPKRVETKAGAGAPAPSAEVREGGAGKAGAATATASTAPSDIKASSDDLHWLPIQKGCGPLHLARLGVGVRKAEGSWEVSAALAGRINLAGVKLELMDAGVDLRLDSLAAPRGRLKGLSLSFRRGAVSVEGGFLRVSENVYGGQLSIQLPKLSVGVVGLYGRYPVGKGRAATSLFLYGALSLTGGAGIKLGAISLTGMALGFGYNRRVVVPDIGAVADFPLVALAMKDGAAAPGDTSSAMETLTALERHLPFEEGQMFAALGLRFTLAEAIDAFALAIAQFGNEVEFSLLGLARFEKSAGAQKFCRVEMALKMTLRPEEGVFLLQAELTGHSWVLDENCRLAGGFALGAWSSGARKGDVVLTLGGYHRDFAPPAHYPTVPRLGLNWAVTEGLTIKGELYCALTPSHLMAGGRLEAAFISGRVKAWFVAAVDFLLKWAPLEYRLDAGISIRVEAELPITTINLSLDVVLSLRGPPFAGRATVKISVLSFEIAFGGERAEAAIETWGQFGALFLDKASTAWERVPAAGGAVEGPAICGASLAGGRLAQPGDKPPGGPWIVRGDELVLSATSVVPATTLAFGTLTGAPPPRLWSGRSLAVAKPLTLEAGAARYAAASPAFGLVPLSVWTAESVLAVTLVKDMAGGASVPVDLSAWQAEPERQAMPAALWDRQPPGDTPVAKMTDAYLTGLAAVRPPAGTRRGEGVVVDIARHRARDLVFRGTQPREPVVEPVVPPGPPAEEHRRRQAETARALSALGLAVDLAAPPAAPDVFERVPPVPPMYRSWQQGA